MAFRRSGVQAFRATGIGRWSFVVRLLNARTPERPNARTPPSLSPPPPIEPVQPRVGGDRGGDGAAFGEEVEGGEGGGEGELERGRQRPDGGDAGDGAEGIGAGVA